MKTTHSTSSLHHPALAQHKQHIASIFRHHSTNKRSSLSRTHTYTTRAGFLDFLSPGTASTSKPPKKGRAQELVSRLLEITDGTEAGIKASNQLREEIAELVEELESYCPRSPLRSELIFGTWEIVYASKPQTAGGPFRSPIGRTVFPGQRAIQIISPPNICSNEVSFKTLGFIPGAARQDGEIEPLNETTFQLTFPALDSSKRGSVGGPPQRIIETLYLDNTLRVARAVPQNEEQEASFYVFVRRSGDEDEGEDINEEEEETEVVVKKPVARRASSPITPPSAPASQSGPSFEFPRLFGARKGGMATQAERAYAAKGKKAAPSAPQPASSSGTQKRGVAALFDRRAGGTTRKSDASTSSTGTGTEVKKTREQLAAERAAVKAAAEEERRAARERALADRASAEEQRRKAREEAEQEKQRARAAAEAERAARDQRRAAARQQLQEATAAAGQATEEARDAVAAFKAAEKATAPLLKQAGQAEELIARAVAAAESAAAALKSAQIEEMEAEKEVLEKQRLVNDLQKRLRQQAEALAPKFLKK